MLASSLEGNSRDKASVYIHPHVFPHIFASRRLGQRGPILTVPHCSGSVAQRNRRCLKQGPTVERVHSCYTIIDLSLSKNLNQSADQTRGVGNSRRDRRDRVSIYAFTTALHLSLSRANSLPCSTDIPLAPNALFTLFIHPILGLTLSLTPLTQF